MNSDMMPSATAVSPPVVDRRASATADCPASPVSTTTVRLYIEFRVMRFPPWAGILFLKSVRSRLCSPFAGVLDMSLSAHLPLCAITSRSNVSFVRPFPFTVQPPPSRLTPPFGLTQTSCSTMAPRFCAWRRRDSGIAPIPPSALPRYIFVPADAATSMSPSADISATPPGGKATTEPSSCHAATCRAQSPSSSETDSICAA
mmetsp:Transcript_25645/g.51032  ORF Transcript_25645/g.51032 Transcript_25645/m.51032 type:complete len:202 (-) Transcript_25645:575-1180(-)